MLRNFCKLSWVRRLLYPPRWSTTYTWIELGNFKADVRAHVRTKLIFSPLNARINKITFAHSVSARIESHFQRISVRVCSNFPGRYIDGMETRLRWNECNAKPTNSISIFKSEKSTIQLRNYSIKTIRNSLPNWPALIQRIHCVDF